MISALLIVCAVLSVVALAETYLLRSNVNSSGVHAKAHLTDIGTPKELLTEDSESTAQTGTASPKASRTPTGHLDNEDIFADDPVTARRKATIEKLYTGIDFPIEFLDEDAKGRFKRFYFNCSKFGYDDRFVRLETLIRSAFFQLAGAQTKARLTVHSSMNELVVDVTIGKAEPIRYLVADDNGAILMSHLSENALPEACSDGVPYVGPIYETSDELNGER